MVEATRHSPSPYIFRLWTAIHAVGAAAERRVWTQLGEFRLYPNLYVFLVGPPGTGKTIALKPVAELLRKSQAAAIAPNDLTKQGLLDALGEATRQAILNGRPFDYHYLVLHIAEITNFFPQYDGALAGILTDLFDCPDINDEKKRGHDKGKAIAFPGISFIMGAATQGLGHVISDEMWGSGFMARVILVYSDEEVVPEDAFASVASSATLKESIITDLHKVGKLVGPMAWTKEAQAIMNHFRRNQKEGAPLHNRLTHYVTRRWLHLAKLCMVAALSDLRMEVTVEDFDLALEWLITAENAMTEVFKDMVSHEDGELHEELRATMFQLYMSTSRRPISRDLIYKWLSKRTSSHNVERVFAVALAANYFSRVAGTSGDDALFIPQSPVGWKDRGVL